MEIFAAFYFLSLTTSVPLKHCIIRPIVYRVFFFGVHFYQSQLIVLEVSVPCLGYGTLFL